MGTNELLYLENLINEMREKEAQTKALQDEIDTVKALIKDKMDTEGLDEVTTATHTVKYSTCERTNIDKKMLQSEYPDIFGKVAKISKYIRYYPCPFCKFFLCHSDFAELPAK